MKKKTTKLCSKARSVLERAELLEAATDRDTNYFIIAHRRRKRKEPTKFYFWYTVFFIANHLKDTRSEMITRKAHVLEVARKKAKAIGCALYYDAGK